ncbi:MAG TPA: DUF58 domain-containing protein [Bryobacteraceae bacterium]|nr:DUF58 domain-containing protein [Bryobacteraceae bacterium]
MSLLRRLRAHWPGAFRQHVTGTGLGFATSVVLLALVAVFSANNLLFLILAGMLAVLGISGFVSKLGLAGLEIDILLPEHISARRKIRAAVRLKNLKRWMSSFAIHVAGSAEAGFDCSVFFPVIPRGATIEEPVDLFFPRRGRWRERSFEFTTRFPFGFAERREEVTTRHDILVYPCLDGRPDFEDLLAEISGDLEARRRGQGHDFYRIRPYEALESARHVDWKATAHTGALQVREFAREDDQEVLIYLDLNVPGELHEWFETAVDCAAYLAYRLNLRGARVGFRTQETSIAVPSEGTIYKVLRYLALVSPRSSAPLEPAPESAQLEIVLTANPQELAGLGQNGGGLRVLDPSTLPNTAPHRSDLKTPA